MVLAKFLIYILLKLALVRINYIKQLVVGVREMVNDLSK